MSTQSLSLLGLGHERSKRPVLLARLLACRLPGWATLLFVHPWRPTMLLLFVMPADTQRAALRKLRRLSRPFFKAIAPPLVLLLVARLTLGRLLARRIDPTLELLFGDDITDL